MVGGRIMANTEVITKGMRLKQLADRLLEHTPASTCEGSGSLEESLACICGEYQRPMNAKRRSSRRRRPRSSVHY